MAAVEEEEYMIEVSEEVSCSSRVDGRDPIERLNLTHSSGYISMVSGRMTYELTEPPIVNRVPLPPVPSLFLEVLAHDDALSLQVVKDPLDGGQAPKGKLLLPFRVAVIDPRAALSLLCAWLLQPIMELLKDNRLV
jgi:hypothetical protein